MPSRPFPRQDQINIMLEEYRALYDLTLYRTGSLERRIPVAGATYATLLGAAHLLPDPVRLALLATLPIIAVWFVATTLNHVRSFEDLLRRIESIERDINARAGRDLLAFQSTHPTRHQHVGGRVGTGSAASVAYASMLLIGLCAALFYGTPQSAATWLSGAYGLLLISSIGLILWLSLRIRTYHYDPIQPATVQSER